MKNFGKQLFFGVLFLFALIASFAQIKYKLTAIMVLNTECPISQNIVQTINQLKIKYPNVDFVSVFTAWDNKQQIQRFKKKYKLQTEIIHDQKHKLIMLLGASKTPEVFLLNNEKNIIYKGAVNNQYLALGTKKSTDITSYLEQAIKDYLKKGFVKVFKTNVIGCKIEPLK